MRSKLATAVMAMTVLLTGISSADVIEIDVQFDQPSIWTDEEGYSHVQLAGTFSTGISGQPALPVKALNLALPPGHEALSLEVDRGKQISLPGTHAVFPAQRPRPLSWRGEFPFSEPDADVYSASGIWPTSAGKAMDLQSMLGVSVLPVQLHPVHYRPQDGTLSYSPFLRVRVVTGASRAKLQPVTYRGLPGDLERAAQLVNNPEILDTYARAPEDSRNPDSRYVIVTSQAMANCSGSNSLQTLLQDKQARGLTTYMETVETIRGSFSGADDPAKIRAFLLDRYQNHGAEFVMLVGDADGGVVGGETEAVVVPVRNLWGDIGSGADEIPSDLYYSALDGDFDANGNGIYGEQADQPDLVAELAVGRAAVDSCAELANFVRKTLAYQNASGSYLNRVYMVGEYLWGEDGNEDFNWGKGYLEQIRVSSSADGLNTQGFSENAFYQVDVLYDRDRWTNEPFPYEGWHGPEMLQIINNEQHLINHLGHSYTNYNMRMVSDDIISGMNNDQYFFEYTQGCYCGSFDNRLDDQMDKEVYWQDSFVEHMTVDTHGAYSAIMNTRYGLGGYSNYFQRLFWDAMFRHGQDRPGPMNNYSKDQLSGYVGGDTGMRWVFYEATLFGDPEVAFHQSASATDPVLALPAEAPWFMVIEGAENPGAQILTVSNAGGGSLNWQASHNAPWLTVSPESGTAPTDVVLSVDATGLSEGNYQTELTFTAPGAADSPQTMLVDFYVIQVPAAVAPYGVGASVTVDGTLSAGEYTGASVIQMGTFSGAAATARMLHDGSVLYFALEIEGDVDADQEDVALLLVDTNGDGLWPSSAGIEGEFDVWANNDFVFWPYFNAGNGQETGQGVYASGVQSAFGMASGHRVAEFSFDLSSSELQRQMGESFRLFLYYLDYNANTQEHELLSIWPFAIRSTDDARYLATVTVGTDSDSLMTNPASLSFQAEQQGGPSDSIQVTISSTTTTQFDFNLSPGAAWLKVNPNSGTTPAVVQVWADPAGQSVGPKSTNLSITAAGAVNSPLPLPVTFQVDEQPASIGVSPAFLSFEYTIGAAPPAAQSLSVSNLGGGNLSWTVSAVGDWLNLNPISGGVPGSVQVTPMVQDLVSGYWAGSVVFDAPGAESVSVEMGIDVRAQPLIHLSPAAITETGALAGGPVEIQIEISNAERGTMDWSLSESANWIQAAPISGTYVTGHPSLVTLTLDPAGLGSGLNEADLLIMAVGASNSPQTLHVAWTLSEGPAIAVDPASLSFTGTEGGANPAAQSLQITNAGQGNLGYSLDCQPAWLSCNPGSGSAPGSTTVVTNLNGLGPGVFDGSVTITSADAVNSPLVVDVSLTVEPGGGDNQAPPAPQLVSPANMAEIKDANPELTINNVEDPDGHAVTYTFEIYRLGQGVAWDVIAEVPPGAATTYVAIVKTLDFDTAYEWRARAVDSQGLAGPWSDTWMFNVLTPDGDDSNGCGCTASGQGRASLFGLLMLIGLIGIRRRRS